MSAIASFALECARTGRWVRGLMALQGHLNSTDAPTRQACVAVAQVAAGHSWHAALTLLHPLDAVQHPQEVCKTIDTVARHPQLPITHFEAVVEAMLRALGDPEGNNGGKGGGGSGAVAAASPSSSPPLTPASVLETESRPGISGFAAASPTSLPQLQRRLFLSATRWCSPETACRLLAALPSPPPRACAERVYALRMLRHSVLYDVGPFAAWAAATGGSTHLSSAAQRRSNNTPEKMQDSSRSTTDARAASADSLLNAPLQSMAEKLSLLDVTPTNSRHRRYSARDRRELARLKELKRQTLLQRAKEEELALLQQALTAVAPSVTSVCAALRVLSRPTASSNTAADHRGEKLAQIKSLLSLVESSRLTPELALLYARAVGLVCSQRWAEALAVLQHSEAEQQQLYSNVSFKPLQEQVNLWLMSRGSWTAALQALHQQQTSLATTTTMRTAASISLALDTVNRTALPPHALFRVCPQRSRPSYRLRAHTDEPVSRQIARALACGVRLDDIQLSVAGKQWAAQGRWENALHLYYRFPLPEFQKYAVRSLVKSQPALPMKKVSGNKTKGRSGGATARSANLGFGNSSSSDSDTDSTKASFSVAAALQLLVPENGIRYAADAPARPAPPLNTYPASLLIGIAADWATALAVFRGCIRGGTRCTPHLLGALLRHTDIPPQELQHVLVSYPVAVNERMRQLVKETFNLTVP